MSALDVWLRFDAPDDEEASHEANTFRDVDGRYFVAWYHTAVGVVTHVFFDTYEEACAWLTEQGYQDFSS
jgi:hypothetical protein